MVFYTIFFYAYDCQLSNKVKDQHMFLLLFNPILLYLNYNTQSSLISNLKKADSLQPICSRNHTRTIFFYVIHLLVNIC